MEADVTGMQSYQESVSHELGCKTDDEAMEVHDRSIDFICWTCEWIRALKNAAAWH